MKIIRTGEMDWQTYFYHRRKEIFDECTARMKNGEIEYSGKDISKTPAALLNRDIIQEIIEELYDQINYCMAQIIKLEIMKVALEKEEDAVKEG